MAYSKIPLNGEFRITCAFGEEGNWKAGYHTGVDLVNEDHIIYSPTFGTIYKIGYDASYGNYIVIADDTPNDAHFHWLCHLSKVDCIIGQKVEPSTRLGIMGATGRTTGVHLHYELRNKLNKYGVVDNPCDYMGVPNERGTYNEQDYQVEGNELKTLKKATNLRNAPTTNSSEKTLYIENTTLFVIEESVAEADGYAWDYVQIRVTGKRGYMINSNYKE